MTKDFIDTTKNTDEDGDTDIDIKGSQGISLDLFRYKQCRLPPSVQ